MKILSNLDECKYSQSDEGVNTIVTIAIHYKQVYYNLGGGGMQ